MHWPAIIFALALPSFLSSAPQTQALPSGVVTLREMRDHVRPVLIFSAKPDDSQLLIQLRRFDKGAAALAERDVVVVAIPYDSPAPTAAMLTNAEAQATRRRLNVAPGDFAVILIGKDGGEKLHTSKPITIERLCETIDAMPMRQDEMRFHPPL